MFCPLCWPPGKGQTSSYIKCEVLHPVPTVRPPQPAAMSHINVSVSWTTNHFSVSLLWSQFLSVSWVFFSSSTLHYVLKVRPPPLETTISYHLLQHHRVASGTDPHPKINFLRCQRDLCCCIHWGQGGKGGGGLSSILWSVLAPFFFLRPQDVFSKGLVHLPRKGRLCFPCTESRISGLLSNCIVCLYEYTVVQHQRKHTFLLVLQATTLYDIWSPPNSQPAECTERIKEMTRL